MFTSTGCARRWPTFGSPLRPGDAAGLRLPLSRTRTIPPPRNEPRHARPQRPAWIRAVDRPSAPRGGLPTVPTPVTALRDSRYLPPATEGQANRTQEPERPTGTPGQAIRGDYDSPTQGPRSLRAGTTRGASAESRPISPGAREHRNSEYSKATHVFRPKTYRRYEETASRGTQQPTRNDTAHIGG